MNIDKSLFSKKSYSIVRTLLFS